VVISVFGFIASRIAVSTLCKHGFCREQVHGAFAPSLLICKTSKKHEPTVQGLLAINLPPRGADHLIRGKIARKIRGL